VRDKSQRSNRSTSSSRGFSCFIGIAFLRNCQNRDDGDCDLVPER
jgi:hypothetical protein